MSGTIKYSGAMLALATLAMPAAGGMAAQPEETGADEQVMTTVYGSTEADAAMIAAMAEGPELEGIISARSGNALQITTADGNRAVVTLHDATQIKASGGFLGLSSKELGANALLNGLPVRVETRQGSGMLVADRIELKSKDMKTAAMIHNGTDQRFTAQEAATEALRGRLGDIDQYNIKSTTHVHFDTGKAALSPGAEQQLCETARAADAIDNALLLVVGYTDSTGPLEYNQQLSEKRAGRVVNHLQQACGWKPYRMLTPTGMAEADPAASNDTAEGKAQNRRVAVNILVSKGLDGL
ncbi:OmpA family protein [Sphingopyxis sp. MWB1]|uniref:OmpA family protein n=1 Tax=Sphingopyxis sp. MWB1 TaxID=1537715 RepID=UPI00051A4FC9|nr:OmpA family protein [Sphingopyxis sp. MWB1]